MTDTFNLVDKPWIRIRDVEGEVREVSLSEALTESHRIERLAGELPTQDFAVLRVLLAVLYRAVAPEPTGDPEGVWEELWNQDRLPAAGLTAYLDAWKPRFDLLDSQRPFMQVPDLHTSKGEWRSLELLVPDCPGPGAMFRRRDPSISLGLGEASRWLLHCQAYDPSGIKSGAVGDQRVKGGKGYPTPVGWAGWMGGQYIEGTNLRETLLLNLVLDRRYDRRDIPLWEEEQHLTQDVRSPEMCGPFGQLGLLTWPERRVRLHVEEGEVAEVLICNGDPIPYTLQSEHELMTPWRFSEPQTAKAKSIIYMPRSLTRGRALWRGLETLLPDPSGAKVKTKYGDAESARPSGVVNWVGKLVSEKVLPPGFQVRIVATGVEYGPQMAVISTVLADRLAFAGVLADVSSGAHRAAATTAVGETDAAIRALGSLADNLVVAAGGDAGPAREGAVSGAYEELDRAFRRWLRDLGPETSPDASLQSWREGCRRTLAARGEELVRNAPPAAWRGREHSGHVVSVGQADLWFHRSLAKALPFLPRDDLPATNYADDSTTERTEQ
ncbi:MAG: type I-E CRISPR-associated protein Cse1/CasA [Dietzia sp.]|uniref:type I-E CRISPR-associated protein Cse1/CasA n=1 Tax=unclassified Dietzia TaxID=2617939 RepID=UPI0015FB032F|nr:MULTISPECIES: type I-E CRISPR-associated protein Cse1/CasA [unclassified Dietzia]MBB1052628.1 type I-E CRISPR-associated protein Cse1/CasA [Dietzia sp. CW19]MBB1055764.1 type I-E CRISPR-associated protein Cse1/CasA [Dietzia sp. B44]MBB1058812.1 type I-E CRISPR-associated protein Cse1/CasA [Dietzia sp. B19]MDO8394647.1 type I-E CRISPR-associated protein Cse1/CasA [Dietzia sp.]